MQRQRCPVRLKLRTSPIHGAPSPCRLAVADMTEIAAVLDRRFALELGGPQLLLDVPMRPAVAGRGEEGPLQGGDSPIHSAFTPARDAAKGILGGTAKGATLSNGLQDILSGGTASGTILKGGYEYVASGGLANGAVISAGTLDIASGGSTGTGVLTFSGAGSCGSRIRCTSAGRGCCVAARGAGAAGGAAGARVS